MLCPHFDFKDQKELSQVWTGLELFWCFLIDCVTDYVNGGVTSGFWPDTNHSVTHSRNSATMWVLTVWICSEPYSWVWSYVSLACEIRWLCPCQRDQIRPGLKRFEFCFKHHKLTNYHFHSCWKRIKSPGMLYDVYPGHLSRGNTQYNSSTSSLFWDLLKFLPAWMSYTALYQDITTCARE